MIIQMNLIPLSNKGEVFLNDSKKIAYYGIFAALSILMGYLERLIPFPMIAPGMKLGLANVIIVIVLYYLGNKPAFHISLIRILISGLLFSGFAGLLYSISGALFSFLMMLICKKTNKMSIIGVSIVGGIFHNIGQILVACLVVETSKLLYYLPILMVVGVVTGGVIGIVAQNSLSYLKNRRF